MKILYWNVNGLRAVDRKGALSPVLDSESPTIMGIQEIKAKPEQLGDIEHKLTDYQCWWHSAQKPGYSGTGLLVRRDFLAQCVEGDDKPTMTVGIPCSDEFSSDTEGRVQCLSFRYRDKKYAVLNIYFPNGGKSEEAWIGKLRFYEAFLSYVNRLQKNGHRVIWGGDVNCAHNEIDLARPKDNEGEIGFRPEERDWITHCINDGWHDLFRSREPNTVMYSWWHMLTRSREKNVGWRIDYIFAHADILERVNRLEYLNAVQGSDHCPVVLSIND